MAWVRRTGGGGEEEEEVSRRGEDKIMVSKYDLM